MTMEHRRCKCHDQPMQLNTSDGYYRCAVRAKECGLKRTAKYMASEKGRAVKRVINARTNRKRLFVGRGYQGFVASREQAEQINAHIRRRLSEFKQRSSCLLVETPDKSGS